MKTINFYILIFILLLSCNKEQPEFQVSNYLSLQEQNEILSKIVRYSEKPAPGADHTTKFNSEFSDYYDLALDENKFLAYYVDNDSTHYFLIARKARSVTPMKEGIAGKLKLDDKRNFAYYEEVFRTWKMPEDSLNHKGIELFRIMKEGGDLSKYGPKYKADRYIEFPDNRFHFDIKNRRWRDNLFDSLQVSYY